MEVHSINIERPFGNLFREKTVLLLIKNSAGKYLFGSKNNYFPEGFTRLMGGGVEKNEDPIDAAKREMNEELGVKIERKNLREIALVETIAIDNQGVKYTTKTFIVEVIIAIDKYKAGDDVTNILELTKAEVIDLIDRSYKIDPTLLHKDDTQEFYWKDYFLMYGKILELII